MRVGRDLGLGGAVANDVSPKSEARPRAAAGQVQWEECEDVDRMLAGETLSEGQRARLLVFKTVEPAVAQKVEEMCERDEIEPSDVAVLVLAPRASEVVLEADGVHVVVGERAQLYDFLSRALPMADGAPFDPYEDLKEPAPPRCVRVLILDERALTVLSYGTFVTVRVDPAHVAQA